METSYKTLIDTKEIIERAYREAEGLTNITAEDFPILVEWIVQKCNTIKIPIPHGRLVDVNTLKSKGINLEWLAQKWINEVDLSIAPTVIEAEE